MFYMLKCFRFLSCISFVFYKDLYAALVARIELDIVLFPYVYQNSCIRIILTVLFCFCFFSLSTETHDSASEIFSLASSLTFKILVSHQVSDELPEFSSKYIRVRSCYHGASANKKSFS